MCRAGRGEARNLFGRVPARQLTGGREAGRLPAILSLMENMPPPPPLEPRYVDTGEDKTVAIVSYLTLIGFIIALVMHGNKKTRLGAFHLRQSLGLMLTGIALGAAITVLGWIPLLGWLLLLLMPVFWIAFIVLWILGLIAAINGQMKPLPWIGEYFHQWFANTF